MDYGRTFKIQFNRRKKFLVDFKSTQFLRDIKDVKTRNKVLTSEEDIRQLTICVWKMLKTIIIV
jgi:hypothetical protein